MSAPELEGLRGYSFELGAIRPPSEGGSHSLLIRATRNCPWNLCAFCYGTPYSREKFQLRSVEEIKKDIETVKAISEDLSSAIKKLGLQIVQTQLLLDYNPSVITVFNWLMSGARTVFLQDANSLIMRTSDLVEVLKYLKQTFPSIERITTYARAKTVAQKTLEELKEIREAGLSRLHVGMETGDDELLKHVNKGVTSEEQIVAGKKAKEAGFELSEYVMPGLGGKARWEQHAKNTARVLNAIDPDFIRLRPYIPRKGTPLYAEYEKGIFQLTSPHERLRELKMMVENLQVTSRLCFDHFMNSWYRDPSRRHPLFKQDYEGYKLPEEKGEVLKLIEEGLAIDESTHMHAKDLIESMFL